MKSLLLSLSCLFLASCVRAPKVPKVEKTTIDTSADHWLLVWVDQITVDQIFRASGMIMVAAAPLCAIVMVVFLAIGMRKIGIAIGTCAPFLAILGIVFVWLGRNIDWIQLLIIVPAAFLGFVFAWKKACPYIEQALGRNLNSNPIIGE